MSKLLRFGALSDKTAIEAVPLEKRWVAGSVYGLLARAAKQWPTRPAISFQLRGKPGEHARTHDWQGLHTMVVRTANMLRDLGVGEGDVVAVLMPNTIEMAATLIAGMTTGIVAPINPLLEEAQIAAILRETGARVLITLASFPKSDVAQKAHAAVALAPEVKTVLSVDLKTYLTPPLSWVIGALRPAIRTRHQAQIMDFTKTMRRYSGQALDFTPSSDLERTCAYFHTGGTTGAPKIACHNQRGALYNGLCPALTVFCERDVMLCPLPLFHVFAAYPILIGCLHAGTHLVLPTPAGYRGEGVIDNFWHLIERWKASFMVMVPTAASALMQHPVNADISSLKHSICGSAPMPAELFRRFEQATGVAILEGYGMTEGTCLVAINPTHGPAKIGSVGLPMPYTFVRILDCDAEGNIRRECGVDEIGEICISGPGIFSGYLSALRSGKVFTMPDGCLRSGDLGKVDRDGYLWITGRSKDLIIRGGHNIDPALIENAMMKHPEIAFAGAIGQPDAHAGETPCVYIELQPGSQLDIEALETHARDHIAERAALPKHIEILAELPKTAIGKVFKPDLRKLAISRIYKAALQEAGIDAEILPVADKTRGMVVKIKTGPETAPSDIAAVLDRFALRWEMFPQDEDAVSSPEQ